MQIFKNWENEHTNKFEKATILLKHRLVETGLFSASSLAKLIDTLPEDRYNLATMGYDRNNPEWREGEIGDVSGKDVIDTIARGRMWLSVHKLQELSDEYQKVVDDIYTEIQSHVPEFSSFKRSIGFLVSSPNIQVFYHMDVPGQSLWQIEGTKKVYIYPSKPPFLKQPSLEDVILGNTEEEIEYSKMFDENAEVYHLQPGEMLNWPLNGPHRVENDDCMNISITTEHWTSDIRKSYAVNYANGVLRRKLGLSELSNNINSSTVYPKAALALFWKSLNLNKKNEVKRLVKFKVDPNSETGMTDIEAKEKAAA